MDIPEVVSKIQEYLPMILGAAQLVKNYYEIKELRKKDQSLPESTSAQKVAEEVQRGWAAGGKPPNEEIAKSITQSALELMGLKTS